MTKERHFNAKSVLLVAGGAIFVALVYLSITTIELMNDEREERLHMIEMTTAFTQTFSIIRHEDNLPPATFRRIGMEQFNATHDDDPQGLRLRAHMRMPGVPGLELNTIEKDTRLRDLISTMAQTKDPSTFDEHRFENGRLIARTMVPSIANDERCVTCHNTALNEEIYQLGDVMGAFVVETDLTSSTIRNAYYAAGAFFLSLIAGSGLALRERRQMQRVVVALEGQVEIEQQRSQAEAHASFLASHDPLTGLANRSMFMERLNALAADCLVKDTNDVFVVIFDLDDFKRVNDSMGHDAGDALLIAVAERIQQRIEPAGGLAARLGGDEFAVVVPAQSPDFQPADLALSLQDALAGEVTHAGYAIAPRVSLGIAAMRASEPDTVSDLLKAADIALYVAKSSGKNCARVFDRVMRNTMGRQNQMANDLPGAISDGCIRLVLQPQVDLRTSAITGFEALARWNWNGEEVSPTEFIKVAEDAGLIRELDLAILRQVGAFTARMIERYGQHIRISSNISGMDFSEPELCETILDLLFETRMPPDLLTLEITETVLVDDYSQVAPTLTQLRKAGIKIALDDFGTGYSSLSYLTKFPFDTIKIDRSFVDGLSNDPDKRILLTHVVELARDLGKSVVVEGIETREQEKLSKASGAQFGQGYLYARPLEIDDAIDLFHANRRSA